MRRGQAAIGMRQPAIKPANSSKSGGGRKRPHNTMARQEANEQFQITSFLDGANAAYIEQLYARYEEDPASVDDQWRSFFKALEEDPSDVKRAAKGASWRKKNWPLQASGDLVSALDGDWGIVEKVIETKVKAKAEAQGKPADSTEVLQATRDSVRAIMMIRAYRMRGHLHAKLDPLGIAAPSTTITSCQRRITVSRPPIMIARSSSTTCSASNTRPSAK